MEAGKGIDQSALRDIVRQLLKAESVKLWLPPYTLADGFSAGAYSPDMVGRYAEASGSAQEAIVAMLESLRQHAIAKLTSRRAGLEPARVLEVGEQLVFHVRHESGESSEISVTIDLKRSGRELGEAVARAASLDPRSFRMVHSGAVVDDDKGLSAQGVRAGSVLLTLPLSEEERRRATTLAAERAAGRLRDAATCLAGREGDDGGAEDRRYVEICDQHGRPLDMPTDERRSLTLALTLHQKGRSMLRRAAAAADYQRVLAVLVESDREFGQCRASILSLVDNYAILCLDICWCQLLLRETAALPEAEHRLASCEAALRKTYGRDMERLARHKQGRTGAEKLLLGRLHLLQAVVAHFAGRPNSARDLLRQAGAELRSLRVDSAKLAELMAMCGCEERAARVSLRASGHDLQRAALDLMEKAEERQQSDERIRERRSRRRRSRKLGRVADGGAYVDADKYDSLCAMGYPRVLCRLALKQCSNNLSAALAALQDSREVLEAAAIAEHAASSPRRQPAAAAECACSDTDACSCACSSGANAADAPDELVQQGVAMGFDEALVRRGLALFGMQLQPLVDHLLDAGGLDDVAGLGDLEAALLADPEQSAAAAGAVKGRKRSHDSMEEAIEKELVADLDVEVDEHLDSTLEKEFELLQEYTTLIESAV